MLVISIPAAPENNIEETARAVSPQLIAVGTRHCRLLRLLSSVYIIPMQTDLISIPALASIAHLTMLSKFGAIN